MLERFKKSGIDWIVVFLGNPGAKYNATRHNVGFMTADVCEREEGIKIGRIRFHALSDKISVNGAALLLLKPQTYMNLSGNSVSEAARFYKVPPERIIVISDDMAIPTGKLRLRAKGSAGGHNGLKSIIERLGTDAFPRIKIGIGTPDGEHPDVINWVLGNFKNQESAEINDATIRAWSAVKAIVTDGIDTAMNKFN